MTTEMCSECGTSGYVCPTCEPDGHACGREWHRCPEDGEECPDCEDYAQGSHRDCSR